MSLLTPPKVSKMRHAWQSYTLLSEGFRVMGSADRMVAGPVLFGVLCR